MIRSAGRLQGRGLTPTLLLLTGLLLTLPLRSGGLPHLILISIDTLRADHLGCYGYYRPTSPRIDRLARESILFDRCLTESPLTVPAMSTVMTSLPAYKHGAKRNGLSIFEGLGTLAESLRKNGYRTAAFISNWPLKDRLSGLGRGFDHFDEVFTKKRWLGLINPEGSAPEVNEAVHRWLDKGAETEAPFFLWIHYSEPHAPYVRHKAFPLPAFLPSKHGRGARKKSIDAYDTEIAFTDQHLGALLDLLKERGLDRNAAIMLLADHGESFGEHNESQHGRRLYQTCLHVPLLLRLPGGGSPPRRDPRLCSLTDLAPTLLACAGLPQETWMEGMNLLDPDSRKEGVFSEAYKGAALLKRGKLFKRKVHPIRFSLTTDTHKLIFNPGKNRFEAYSWPQDHSEEENIFISAHQTLRPLRARLIDHIRDLKTYIQLGEKKFSQPAAMTEEDLEKLRSLGYID